MFQFYKQTSIKISVLGFFMAFLFSAISACITGHEVANTDPKPTQKKNKMKIQQGWHGQDVYWSYGEAKADTRPQSLKETKESSCKRKALFAAKNRIIPAFMSSPNARPSYNLKQKMTTLLRIIENGEIVKFKFFPAQERCRVLLKIEKKGLRSMVEEVK